ncbi:MAG: NAD(P)H-hydrate dehydratase [Acidimicrobiia bacterium]
MEPLLSPENVREADSSALANGQRYDDLVDRAGRAVAWAARRLLGGTYGRTVLVVAGPGSNGADGRLAAQQLRSWGCVVHVIDLEDPSAVGAASLDRDWRGADLVIDAMFGIGGSRPLDGVAADVATRTHAHPRPLVLAVDVPSGVDALTGTMYGVAVHADATVTFQANKTGLLFEPARSHAGAISVVDIDIPIVAAVAQRIVRGDVEEWWQPRSADAHKWSAGAVLVVGGSPGMFGAPLLAARAAMHAGAGMVRAAMPTNSFERSGDGAEVIEVSAPATPHGLSSGAVMPIARAAQRMHAVVIGPGIGRDAEAADTTRTLIATLDHPLVVDADAINALADDPSVLRVRAAASLPPIVLTPHDGEYARLMGHPPGLDRIEAAKGAAVHHGAVVLLKGATTVVATPEGQAMVIDSGTSALATAGTGDVLSGVIAALIAHGMSPNRAAAAGAWIHGTASVDIAVASDLLGPIAQLRRELDRTCADAAATHPRHN